jgi:hypothetical protein
VDASILTVDDYLNIRKYLCDHWPANDHPDLVDIAEIITVLGFRCGLRRMEVLMLRVGDFCGGERTELLVRPWALRKLKTPNATRRIPLYALLNHEESVLLSQWVQKRDDEVGLPCVMCQA